MDLKERLKYEAARTLLQHRLSQPVTEKERFDCHYALIAACFELNDAEAAFKSLSMLHTPGRHDNVVTLPVWTGEALYGRTIALLDEGGFGDSIDLMRYVRFLKDRGAYVMVVCRRELVRLYSCAPYVDMVVDLPADLVEITDLQADCYCPVYDLPYRLCPLPPGEPRFQPYMRVEPSDVRRWRNRLADGTGRKRVGIVWSSGTPQSRYRPAADFKEITALPQFAFYSMQKGPHASEITDLPAVTDLGPELTDFYETACAIMATDLVITVDTAVAHLAGALGRPVWMITNYQPHWRWRGETRDCVWYPSMRLYRRPASLLWEAVLDEIEVDLSMAFPDGKS